MLSNNAPSTPRPRPPAKMRRAPSLPLHPPPPYAPRLDMILDSPISVTTQLIRSPSGEGAPDTETMEQWMNEKSRGELSDLLVAAEDIIKTRETELSLTSALCKNLYQENAQLKTRHDALLSRLPIPNPSPLPSPTRSLSPLPPGSPHYYSLSRPHSPVASTPPRLQHARRISVTPGELSLLADQNAELLYKLEQLEEESAQADLAGKRKLRKLEREIQGLREELEKTRANLGAELEEKTNSVLALSEEETLRRQREKEERAERAKALREKSSAASSAGSTGDSSLAEPVRDFAPPSELSSAKNGLPAKSPATRSLDLPSKVASPITIPPLTAKSASPMSEPLPILHAAKEVFVRSEPSAIHHPNQPLPSSVSSYFPQDAQTSTTPGPPLEYAIISQLLMKIRELEETNAQISVEQRTTTEKLQAAQWDAESISRAYEVLVDGQREVHVVAEDDEVVDSDDDTRRIAGSSGRQSATSVSTRKRGSTGDTIRFSSLRRTIDGDLSRTSSGVFSAPTSPDREQIELDFAEGILKELQSTTRSHLAELPGSHRHYQKARKSVMGLFEGVAAASSSAVSEPVYPRMLNVSPAFRARARAEDDAGDVSMWSTDATDGYAHRSPCPVPSFLISPSPSRSSSPSPSTHMPMTGSRIGHTLGSELGMEDWPVDDDSPRWNHHLRASSLCDLTGISSVGNESLDTGTALAGEELASTGQTALSLPQDPASISPSTPPRSRPASHPSSEWEDVSDDDTQQAHNRAEGSTVITSHSAGSGGSATPTRGPLGMGGLQLQLVVEPPTPTPDRPLRTSRSTRSLRMPAAASTSVLNGLFVEGSAREGRASRNQRLSQTVRARTNRWVERMERRYGTLGAGIEETYTSSMPVRSVKKRKSLGALRGQHPQGPRRASGTLDMDETFETIMEQFSRSNIALSRIASSNSGSRVQDDVEPDASFLSAELSRELEQEGDVSLSAEVMAARPRREGFVGLLLEVWLWLQFVVVVMVFLWAMARRGPKNVLEDAERRRGVVRRGA